MDRLTGYQLSLIAEDDNDLDSPHTDWSIDTAPIQSRSFEQIRSHFVDRANGGQAQSKSDRPLADGGQERSGSVVDGGQHQSGSIVDGGQHQSHQERSIVDGGQGGWIEIDKRKGGTYKYRRWRDRNGVKRSQYLGTAI